MTHVLEQIDKLRERNAKRYAGLAHEFGAGAACKKCGDKCSGFELHYWRKICLNCRCQKEEHDIDESLLRDKIRWNQVGELVSKKHGSKFEAPKKFIMDAGVHKEQEIRIKDSLGPIIAGAVELDWAPNASPELVKMYFNSVPREKWPVAGSAAAETRRKKLEAQIPLQDIVVECLVDSKPEERQGLENYIEHISTGIIGQAEIMRFKYPVAEVSMQGQAAAMASPIQDNSLAQGLGRLSMNPTTSVGHQRQQAIPYQELRYSDIVGSPSRAQDFSPLSTAARGPTSPAKSPPAVPPKPFKQHGFHVQGATGISPPSTETANCHHCSGLIRPGDIVVKAPEVKKDPYWHPNCFVCASCGDRLEDLIYCHDGDKVFCGRHYAEKARGIPRCRGCDQLIFARQFTKAEGAYWHLEHFACWQCDKQLAGKTYTCIDGNPYCTPCYIAKETLGCKSCSGPIIPGTPRIALPKAVWHMTDKCFCCAQCLQSLVSKKFLFKSEKLFCSSDCWRTFGNQAATA